MGNSEFDKVMKALKNQKGLSQSEREAQAKKLKAAQAQAEKFRKGQERVKKLRKKQRGHGGDDVIDSGQFSS